MNAVPLAKITRMSVGEFLDWPGDGSDRAYDLVLGEPVAQAAPSLRHSEIQAQVTGLLHAALADRRPCRPLTELGIFRSRRHFNYRTADIAISCDPPDDAGPPRPSVVFEMLSPSNMADTLGKVGFYAGFDFIQEIVLIDSRRIAVSLFRRGAGEWAEAPAELLGAGEALHLTSVGISLEVNQIGSSRVPG